MPIYEYACDACSHGFETLIRNRADEEELQCPACGDRRLHKQMSVFGVQGDVAKPITGASSSCGGCTSSSCGGCKH